jgi:hypothetical protein
MRCRQFQRSVAFGAYGDTQRNDGLDRAAAAVRAPTSRARFPAAEIMAAAVELDRDAIARFTVAT